MSRDSLCSCENCAETFYAPSGRNLSTVICPNCGESEDIAYALGNLDRDVQTAASMIRTPKVTGGSCAVVSNTRKRA